jgi:cytochrome c oxidase subunit IV
MASHAHTSDPHHREGYDFAHPFPVWGLLAVFVALTILTVITVAQANFDLGNLDVAVTMVIATIKASLVMLFFMHLAFDKPFHLIVFLSSFVFVALFVILTLSDARMNANTFEQVYDEPPPVASTS